MSFYYARQILLLIWIIKKTRRTRNGDDGRPGAFYPSENRPRRTFIEGYNFTSKTGNDSYCSMANDETGSSWIFYGDPVSRKEDHSAVELSDGCFSNRTKIFFIFSFLLFDVPRKCIS